jgi:hypothetical protein
MCLDCTLLHTVGIDRTDAYVIGLSLVLSYTTRKWEDAAILLGAYAYLRYHYMRQQPLALALAPKQQQRQQQRAPQSQQQPAYYYTQQHIPVIARRVRPPLQWGPRMDFATQ